jgi:LytS/YehU family sensor histidine kinase
VAVALAVTGIFRGLGYPVGPTLQSALVHSVTITVLATWVLSRVMRRLRAAGPAMLWVLLIPILLGVAVVGTALACGLHTTLGLGRRHGVWMCFTNTLTLNTLLTATIGMAMVIYAAQRDRLDALTLELRTRELGQERANKMALEARLSTLEARLHPHFLFNTLNAISALVREDPDEAERTVERLAALLRFSLDATQRGLVPVADELKIVADYLEIERTRLGDRLSYAIKVAPTVTGWMIPPLLVQTLVENSVKHAIAPRSSGGHIRVDASAQGERLVVGVWDDGPGFSPDSIVPGHGLDNLKGRLAARFGTAATFTVAPHDGGTLVTVAMPHAGHDLA